MKLTLIFFEEISQEFSSLN